MNYNGTSKGFKKVLILALEKRGAIEHHFLIRGSIYGFDYSGIGWGFKKVVILAPPPPKKKKCFYQ
jgi:hypothetical protein